MDDTTLKFHDVVPGGIISLCVWPYDGWMELVLAAAEGDPSKVFSWFFTWISYLMKQLCVCVCTCVCVRGWGRRITSFLMGIFE